MKQINKRKSIVGALLVSALMCGSVYANHSSSMIFDISGDYTGKILRSNGDINDAKADDFIITSKKNNSGASITTVAGNLFADVSDASDVTVAGTANPASSVELTTVETTSMYAVDGSQYHVQFVSRVGDTIAHENISENLVADGANKNVDINSTAYAAAMGIAGASAAEIGFLTNTEFDKYGLDVYIVDATGAITADYITVNDTVDDQTMFIKDNSLTPTGSTEVTTTNNGGFDVVTKTTFEAAEVATAADIATNADGIATNVADIATNADGIATNAAGIATNVADIATNAAGIATNAADIATNTASINDLKAEDEKLKAGIAMSVALSSNIYLPNNKESAFGISVGQFDGETAIALQAVYRIENDTVLNFGAANSSSNTAYRAGVSFAW